MSKIQLKKFGIELLPCPFCGKKYKGLNVTMHMETRKFECPFCGAEGPFPQNPKQFDKQKYFDIQTIKAWNTRKKD